MPQPTKDTDAFQKRMARIRLGDQQAAKELFKDYARRLCGLARARLGTKYQAKLDPEDVLQSALGSFFRRQSRGDFEIPDSEHLWSLLALITANKCQKWIAFYGAGKRNIGLDVCNLPTGEESLSGWHAIAADPKPSEALILTETVENLMREISPKERKMLLHALQGFDSHEIAEMVARSERTVRRFLNRIRIRLEQSGSNNSL